MYNRLVNTRSEYSFYGKIYFVKKVDNKLVFKRTPIVGYSVMVNPFNVFGHDWIVDPITKIDGFNLTINKTVYTLYRE